MAEHDKAEDKPKITVVIADDSPLIRNAIGPVLQFEPLIKIVGEAATFAELFEMVSKLKPRVVITDVHMPGDLDHRDITNWKLRPAVPATAMHGAILSSAAQKLHSNRRRNFRFFSRKLSVISRPEYKRSWAGSNWTEKSR